MKQIATPLKASKWSKISLLVEAEEMESLFNYFQEEAGVFSLYYVQGLTGRGEESIPLNSFLEQYKEYIRHLKEGSIPPNQLLPSPVLSLDTDSLYTIEVGEDKQLTKPCLPVLQLQASQIRFSREDQIFRSQLFGNDNISWGVQFSYPQVYQDSVTYEIHKVHDLPNTKLFRSLQKWVRLHTRPTPFLVDNIKYNVPYRLGKRCFSWINSHPQLQSQNIHVKV